MNLEKNLLLPAVSSRTAVVGLPQWKFDSVREYPPGASLFGYQPVEVPTRTPVIDDNSSGSYVDIEFSIELSN